MVNNAPCCGNGLKQQDGSCKCRDDYKGTNCEFYEVTSKYACSSKCEHGHVLEDGSCACDDGYEGYHCDHKECVHGKWGCPSEYCSDDMMVCKCENGFEGKQCDARCHELDCIKGQGTWNEDECKCDCAGPWEGRLCDICKSKVCPSGLIVDPNTCGCACPATDESQCLNDGIVNEDGCTCECVGGWGGSECGTCIATNKSCDHDGIWNEDICMCECPTPWDTASNCEVCPITQCYHGGKFTEEECTCSCLHQWEGASCDICPTEAELLVNGIDCGAKGFDRETCRCNDKCPLVDCLNGGKYDTENCVCECNVMLSSSDDDRKTNASSNGTDANAQTSWSGDRCETCELQCDDDDGTLVLNEKKKRQPLLLSPLFNLWVNNN